MCIRDRYKQSFLDLVKDSAVKEEMNNQDNHFLLLTNNNKHKLSNNKTRGMPNNIPLTKCTKSKGTFVVCCKMW